MHSRLASLGALVLLPSLASADVLVNWGNNVTADTSTEHIVSGAVSFSTSTPRSPSSPAYSGGSFYGGAVTTGSSNGVDRWFIDDDATTTGFTAGDDLFNFRVGSATVGAGGYAALLWKQTDFASLSTGDVTVTDFSFRGRLAGGGIVGDVRFIVVSEGVTLISAPQALSNSTALTLTLSDPGSQSWSLYDPATSLTSIGSAYDVSGFSFSNVSMAGVLLRQEKTASTGNMTLVMQSFTLNGVATPSPIPEPSAYAALAGLLGLVGASLRRRRSA